VTSVSPGGTSGAATVDVVAAVGADNGCAADKYEFRTSTTGEWVSAPALNFSIVYDLTSGQSVCVQMRSHNEAGWGRASASTCGNARNSAAESSGGSGGGGGSSITVSYTNQSYAVTPVSVSVGVGGTFTVTNTMSGTDVYVDGAAASSGGLTCGTYTNCMVPRGSIPTTFTVASAGSVTIRDVGGPLSPISSGSATVSLG
jgi:hypothetical protein